MIIYSIFTWCKYWCCCLFCTLNITCYLVITWWHCRFYNWCISCCCWCSITIFCLYCCWYWCSWESWFWSKCNFSCCRINCVLTYFFSTCIFSINFCCFNWLVRNWIKEFRRICCAYCHRNIFISWFERWCSWLWCTLDSFWTCICSYRFYRLNHWSIRCLYFYIVWPSCLYCCWLYFTCISFIRWCKCYLSCLRINCIFTNDFLSILFVCWNWISFCSIFYKFITIWFNSNCFFNPIYIYALRCKCWSTFLNQSLNICRFRRSFFQLNWNNNWFVRSFWSYCRTIIIII